MPCGKRPLVKLWDKPKNIRHIKPSRYEQNEASVKVHWKNVIKSLELSYKDEQFWDTNIEVVRELVGPTIFQRIAKIFYLPVEAPKPVVESEIDIEDATIIPSAEFYVAKPTESALRPEYSLSDYKPEEAEEEQLGEESEAWTDSSVLSVTKSMDKKSKMKSLASATSRSVNLNVSKSLDKLLSKSFSRIISRTLSKTWSSKLKSVKSDLTLSSDSPAATIDDLIVQPSLKQSRDDISSIQNPHFDMLYCNESETDMIKWESHYKTKTFEVSASDEFSKRAEILTKQIARDFYDWWVGLGNLEFKSEIKRPEDIETLFQVWFDEHASRGLVVNPLIIPCVLKSIAEYTSARKSACPAALKRQIAYDIEAETAPAHIKAFGTSLPQKMKHIPPKNNTEEMWHSVRIPEDLRTMSYVWDDIQHLTSTKAFRQWLIKHPHLPMPPCFKSMDAPGEKKQLFVVPSDYFAKDKLSATSIGQELALPVSQFSLELKQVLSKLMNE